MSVDVVARDRREHTDVLFPAREAAALGQWLEGAAPHPRGHLSLPSVIGGAQTVVSLYLDDAELRLELGARAARTLAGLLRSSARGSKTADQNPGGLTVSTNRSTANSASAPAAL